MNFTDPNEHAVAMAMLRMERERVAREATIKSSTPFTQAELDRAAEPHVDNERHERHELP